MVSLLFLAKSSLEVFLHFLLFCFFLRFYKLAFLILPSLLFSLDSSDANRLCPFNPEERGKKIK